MKKGNKKHNLADKDADDEIKLLAEFAIQLDKKNQVFKKLLEQKALKKIKTN